MILKTLVSLIAPMAFLRLYGGGGDGGSAQMRADEQQRQRKVQSAVDTINAKFGIAPSSGAMETTIGAAPTPDNFTTAGSPGYYQDIGENGPTTYVPGSAGGFDEAAYNKALADYNSKKTQIYGGGEDIAQAKGAREAMYGDIAGAVRDTAMRDLDRQYSQASNRNKFGLARSGLMGGSVDAESGGELQDLYGTGKLKATQAGLAAGSDLRSTDEKTRQNLISLAQSGIDTGTAASLAAGQMGAAADLAKSQSATASVGRLFDDMSQAYAVNQVLKARYPNGMPMQGQQTQGYGTTVFNPSRYTGSVQK